MLFGRFILLSCTFLFVYSIWNCLDFLTPWFDLFYQFGEFIAINFSDSFYFLPLGCQLNMLDWFTLSSVSVTFSSLFSIFCPCWLNFG